MNLEVFGDEYSSLYDVLYKEKNYRKEVDFIEKLISKKDSSQKILDLGCGTGGHAFELAKRGYDVLGVDISENMIEQAEEKLRPDITNIKFQQSSIQEFENDFKFDAIISMFAVIGYQTDSKDLIQAFRNVKKQLRSGGTFIFDVWNGAAVLLEKPENRVKEIKNDDEKIIRIAKPDINYSQNLVEVNYRLIKIINDSINLDIRESHKMRYFFPEELRSILLSIGFKDIKIFPFLNYNAELKENDWNIMISAKA